MSNLIARRAARRPVAPSSRITVRGTTRAVFVDGERLFAIVAGRELAVYLVGTSAAGDRPMVYELTGGPWGAHTLAADGAITSPERLLTHWRGYVENAKSKAAAK